MLKYVMQELKSAARPQGSIVCMYVHTAVMDALERSSRRAVFRGLLGNLLSH